ncbi:MAG: hypothetical protein HY717_04780 [Planctomycetes bacterium]|nr:hypothetical protein [Planctomycetota bacterium]
MKKGTTKDPAVNDGQVPQVSRLDEKITTLTLKTVEGIQRFRVTILTLIALVLFAFTANWLYRQFVESQEESLSGRFYTLLMAPETEDRSIEAILPELDQLLDEAKGKKSEKWHLKESVDQVLAKARELVFKREDPSLATEGAAGGIADKSPDKPTAPPASASPSPAVFEKIEKYIASGKERFADDHDMQAWADGKLKEVQYLKGLSSSLPPASRGFKPFLPSPATGPGDGTQAAPTSPPK